MRITRETARDTRHGDTAVEPGFHSFSFVFIRGFKSSRTMNDLADIIAPLPPPPAPWPVAWLIAGAVFVMLALLGWLAWRWHRRRLRRQALRRIKLAEKALAADTLDPREAAFIAAEALRQAYRVTHITPAQVTDVRWQTLVAQLDALRYHAVPADAPLAPLLRETRHWIRRAPC